MRYQSSYVRIALPKGRLLSATADLLDQVGLDFEDYDGKTRQYNLQSVRFPRVSARVFQEKDIAVQVAVGNYDLGICGLDWIEELRTRYPASAVVEVSRLDYGEGYIYLAASQETGLYDMDGLSSGRDNWRIVTEYPNLAHTLTSNLRLKSFKIFPVWGAAEAYPPENADLVILWARNENEMRAQGLVPIMRLLSVDAFLIANRERLENKDLSEVLGCLSPAFVAKAQTLVQEKVEITRKPAISLSHWKERELRLALPDGHQKVPTAEFLQRAGLNVHGYCGRTVSRRLSSDLEWLGVKVIRPQDMPLQVANGNFDVAVTGRDWLLEHLYRFPSSPVMELLDLGFGAVRIVAALSREMAVDDIDGFRSLVQSGKLASPRVASEYTNIADRYLRDNHISSYRLIPTWGASEAFLPEDADLLIDNTQTGRTLAQHDLRIIDVLLKSTACLIANKESLDSPGTKEKIERVVEALGGGLS